MKRSVLGAFLVAVTVVASGHVGSPNVVFDGNAGPYAVRVIVRPPEVVPGLAEVIVRADAPDIERIVATPVFYRAGAAGAPRPDELRRVAGQTKLYSGTLWLMSRGSSSVYVTVRGARGSGTAIVPVAALATGRLPLSRGLAAILVVLAVVLFAGFVTIVRAASSEALLEPGASADEMTKRRGRRAALVTAPILALLVLGGAKWWGAVDAEYQRFMFKPPRVTTRIAGRQLTLWVKDTAAFRAIVAEPVPDHGKMMHLFLIRSGTHDVFVHLHPSQIGSSNLDSLQFTTSLPAMPGGNYDLFGDIVLANGLSLTLSTSLRINEGTAAASDSDDSWAIVDRAVALRPGAAQPLGGGLSLVYMGDSSIVAHQPVDLNFEVRSGGGLTSIEPYMGMAAHAVVLRGDNSVFVHLHPMGTISMDAQRAFAARDSGNVSATMSHTPMNFDGRFRIPYEFPKAGQYRIWIQVKANARVLTGAFDIDVR
jgi:hypothetical protein